MTERSAEALRRIDAAERVRAVDLAATEDLDDVVEAALVQEWDAEISRLLAQATPGAGRVLSTCRCPPVCRRPPSRGCATIRMPSRATSSGRCHGRRRPAARFGTRFHAWVESRFDQQDLFDPDELPGQADAGIDSDADLSQVIEAFESGPFADRVPHAVEAPFGLVLAGQVVRGRIDAVYAEATTSDGEGFLVVDWKTGRTQESDPLQLAIYRVAWAELMGCRLDQVRAAFYYVRTGDLIEPPGLPDREQLEALIVALDG